MDERPVIWDHSNRKHLEQDHPERKISPSEIEQVLRDEERVETFLEKREAFQVVGRTSAGKWLVVIWIDQAAGRYPIHARQASKTIIRRMSQ